MESVSLSLFILMAVISVVAVSLRPLGLSWGESLSVGVGHCTRAEMAFILSALGLSMGTIDERVFSVSIFTAFLLNLFTSTALKGCALRLKREGVVPD
jgi:Kef-type K+ transport system membrane component KefB